MAPNRRNRRHKKPKKLVVNGSELRDKRDESEAPESREVAQDVPLDVTTGARENSEASLSPEKQPLDDVFATVQRLPKITLTPITDETPARLFPFSMGADCLELISLSSGSVVGKAGNLVELVKRMSFKEPDEVPDSSLPLLKTIKKEIDSEDGEALPPALQEQDVDLSSAFDFLYTTSSSSSGDDYQFMLEEEEEASGFQTPPASDES